MHTDHKLIHTIREGAVQGSIWINTTAKARVYQLTLSRSSKDERGQWNDSTTYEPLDITSLLLVVIKAEEWMRHHPLATRNTIRTRALDEAESGMSMDRPQLVSTR